MQAKTQIIAMIRGLIGAALGGAAGYFAFGWILGYGLYAMIIPGAALGYGFGALAGERNTVNGIVSAVLATGLGLFTESSYRPFDDDKSFSFFVAHIHQLTPITLLMIAAGSVLAFWSASGSTRSTRHDDPPRSSEN
jgi:hypothetical protein